MAQKILTRANFLKCEQDIEIFLLRNSNQLHILDIKNTNALNGCENDAIIHQVIYAILKFSCPNLYDITCQKRETFL